MKHLEPHVTMKHNTFTVSMGRQSERWSEKRCRRAQIKDGRVDGKQTNHMSIRPITCPLDSHSAAQRREVAWDSSVETIVIQANLEDLGHVGEATRYGASEAIGRKVQESQWQIPKEARDAAGQAFHMP